MFAERNLVRGPARRETGESAVEVVRSRPICLIVGALRSRAASRAACTTGNSRAISTPMIVITTRSSTSVNADARPSADARPLADARPSADALPWESMMSSLTGHDVFTIRPHFVRHYALERETNATGSPKMGVKTRGAARESDGISHHRGVRNGLSAIGPLSSALLLRNQFGLSSMVTSDRSLLVASIRRWPQIDDAVIGLPDRGERDPR